MNAKDIMTSKVITVTSATLVSEIARLPFERRISALPVVDGERLAGIVSEADLLHRYEIGTDCATRCWRRSPRCWRGGASSAFRCGARRGGARSSRR